MLRAMALVAAGAAAAAVAGPSDAPPVTVAAAVSLTEAMTAAADAFAPGARGTVRFTFAASNVLARQIVAGAPIAIFVSADEAQMNVVAGAGLLVDGSRIDLLANQLVIVVPDDRARTLTSARDLLDRAFTRIAVGDPAAVPAGVYARAYLEREGLWAALQPRIVPTGSVRAALTAAESGAADAAIVYRTDAATSTRTKVAWTVPEERAPRIVYPAARIRGAGETREAAAFLAFLAAEPGMRVLERFGFVRPRPAG